MTPIHRIPSWRQAALPAAMLTITLWLAMSVTPAYAQNAQPQRFIIKWQNSETISHAKRVNALSSRVSNRSGINLQHRRALTARLDVVQLDSRLDAGELTDALAQLNADSAIEYAAVDQRRRASSTVPSEQYYLASSGRTQGQWYLGNAEVAAIKAVDAWDYSKGGNSDSGVVVAVIDTGVVLEHPDLSNKLLPGYDFVSCDLELGSCDDGNASFLTANDDDGWDDDPSDPGDWISAEDLARSDDYFDGCGDGDNADEPYDSSWHGTRVAGIIGAETDNGIGIAGTGWNTRILPVRVLGKCGGWDSDIIAGMYWAAGFTVSGVPTNANPAKVINLSLGGAGECTSAYVAAINDIRMAGVSIVASAGNDSAILHTPANCSGVISVVGVRHTGTKVGFSSLGSATIAAPAGNCPDNVCSYSLHTTVNLGATTPTLNDYTDETNFNLGTSFSAPLVSGTIALMLGVDSSLTPTEISDSLRRTATAFPATATNACIVPTDSTPIAANEEECNCTTSTCGAGLLNALAAVIDVGESSSSSSSNNTSSNGGGGSFSLMYLWLFAGLAGMRRGLK